MASSNQTFHHESESLSLYIPVMKSCHSDVQYIKKVFRNAGIGDVYRVDLIARNGGDPSQANELSAFVYLDWYTYGVSYMWHQCVLAKNPYMPANFYHSKYDNNPFKDDDSSYWILLKNDNPRTLEQVEAEKQVAIAKTEAANAILAETEAANAILAEYGITAHDDHAYYNDYATGIEYDVLSFIDADARAADADARAADADARAADADARAADADAALTEADTALAEAGSNSTKTKRSPPPLCTDDECSGTTCMYRTQPISDYTQVIHDKTPTYYALDNENGILRREVCELESTNYELENTNYELENTNYDLEVENYDLRLANYDLEIKLAEMEKRNKNIMKELDEMNKKLMNMYLGSHMCS